VQSGLGFAVGLHATVDFQSGLILERTNGLKQLAVGEISQPPVRGFIEAQFPEQGFYRQNVVSVGVGVFTFNTTCCRGARRYLSNKSELAAFKA